MEITDYLRTARTQVMIRKRGNNPNNTNPNKKVTRCYSEHFKFTRAYGECTNHIRQVIERGDPIVVIKRRAVVRNEKSYWHTHTWHFDCWQVFMSDIKQKEEEEWGERENNKKIRRRKKPRELVETIQQKLGLSDLQMIRRKTFQQKIATNKKNLEKRLAKENPSSRTLESIPITKERIKNLTKELESLELSGSQEETEDMIYEREESND